MRTFYLTLIALVIFWLSVGSVKAGEQIFDYWQYELGYEKDFSKGPAYREIIKKIYSPQILKRVEICRANLKKWTSISGSLNLGLEGSKKPEDSENYVNVLMEASVKKTSPVKVNRKSKLLNYSVRGRAGLDKGGLSARFWKYVGSGIFVWDNEFIQNFNTDNNTEYKSILKFEWGF